MLKHKNKIVFVSLIISVLVLTLLDIVIAVDVATPVYFYDPHSTEKVDFAKNEKFETNIYNGAATYKYNINVPPGRIGLTPELFLYYDSDLISEKSQFLGDGWDLNQMYIERDFNGTDNSSLNHIFRLHFEGNVYPLVYVSSEQRFHTKIEVSSDSSDHFYIDNRSGGNNQKGEYWILKKTDGTTYRFGFNSSSEVIGTENNLTWRWYIDQINDTHNNTIFYNYKENPFTNDSGAVYLDEISYNNEQVHKIKFIYETTERPNSWVVYGNGNGNLQTRRLTQMNITSNSALVSQVKISYQSIGLKTFISTITIYGSDGISSLPPVQFQYFPLEKGFTNATGFTLPTELYFYGGASGNGNPQPTLLMDINGDGFLDLVYNKLDFFGSSNNAQAVLLNHNGTGWFNDTNWTLPTVTPFLYDINSEDAGTRISDLNNDGFPDFIELYRDASVVPDRIKREVWLNNGNGSWTNSTGRWSFPEDIYFGGDAGQENVSIVLLDINNDGYDDIVQGYKDSETSTHVPLQRVFINNGSGWNEDSHWSLPPTVVFRYGTSDAGTRFGDLNGDGLLDIIQLHERSCCGVVKRDIWLNTGQGWLNVTKNWSVPNSVFFSDSQYPVTYALVDLNNDGLVDLVNSSEDNLGGTKYQSIGINNGSGWFTDPSYNFPPSIGLFVQSGNKNDLGTRFGDLNGDGSIDIIQLYRQCPIGSCAPNYIRREVWLNNVSKTYLIKSINNSLGESTAIDYTPSTSFDNSGDDTESDLAFNVWVVSNKTERNGVSGSQSVTKFTEYDYTNGMYDYASKEFRGFGIVAEDPSNSTRQGHFFYQDDAKQGKEYQTIFTNASGSSVGSVYLLLQKNWGNISQNGYYLIELTAESEAAYDGVSFGPRSKTKDYTSDIYGNILSVKYEGDESKSGDEKYEYNEYVYNTNAWVVNKIKRYALYKADNTTKQKETLFFYDGSDTWGNTPTKGELSRKQEWLRNQQNFSTRFYYDSYGNVITERNARLKNTTYVFGIIENTSTYPDQIIDSLNHTFSYRYDLGTGNIISEIDSSNFTTSYEYDSLGRLSKIIEPYDSSTYPTVKYEYGFDGTAPEQINISYREINGTNNTFDEFYFYDGFSDPIQIRKEGVGLRQIEEDIYYDSLGRVSRKSNPYFVSSSSGYKVPSNSIASTLFIYDPLDRVITLRNQDSSSKNIVYNHWNETFYDENQNPITKEEDAYENIIATYESVGNNTYKTNYSYDESGNLLKIIDSKGNEFSFGWDSLGRMVNMSDPDLGYWAYAYSSTGMLVNKTDANGNILDYQYDNIDRVTRENSSDGTYTYVYDKGTNMTLAQTKNSDLKINYTYDERLRKVTEQKLVDGLSFTTNYSYDSLDRVTYIIFPNKSQTINYTYNVQGRIKNINNLLTVNYTEFGISSRVYGNGLTSHLRYNSTTLRLVQIETSNKQDINFSYDLVGNMVFINDSKNNLQITVKYDNLNRINQSVMINKSSGKNVYSINYTYDSIGNILQITSNQTNISFLVNTSKPIHGPKYYTNTSL